MFKISIREILCGVAIIGLVCGWTVDRHQLVATHAAEIKVLENQVATYKKTDRVMFGLKTEDVFEALVQRVELPTMVSGVESVSVFGFGEFNGQVSVKFNNGKTIIQVADKAEFDEARKIIAQRKK